MLYKNSILTVWFRILEATSYLLVFVDNHAGTGRVKVTTGSMDHVVEDNVLQSCKVFPLVFIHCTLGIWGQLSHHKTVN